jgi:MoxR-like ATPase
MGEVVRRVALSDDTRRFAVSLVAATQPQSEQAPPLVRQFVRYGSGPRGAHALVLGATVRAAVAGRSEVAPEDLQAVALPALRHRLMLNYEAVAEEVSPDTILAQVLQGPTPR